MKMRTSRKGSYCSCLEVPEKIFNKVAVGLLGTANALYHCANLHVFISYYRADVNILLCGDPGTSKSQLLQVNRYLVM